MDICIRDHSEILEGCHGGRSFSLVSGNLNLMNEKEIHFSNLSCMCVCLLKLPYQTSPLTVVLGENANAQRCRDCVLYWTGHSWNQIKSGTRYRYGKPAA